MNALLKRLFDIVVSLFGLALLFPLFLFLIFKVRRESNGPAFFLQVRVGMHGRLFKIIKFRTMVTNAEALGLSITSGEDPRITRVGKWLRKYKLDELPQLINVALGDMSFVGPRPEVKKYMDQYPYEAREKILSIRPGITDRASIEFRDENDLLGVSSDPEKAYVEEVMPIKQKYYLEYVENHTFFGDLKLIILTIKTALLRV